MHLGTQSLLEPQDIICSFPVILCTKYEPWTLIDSWPLIIWKTQKGHTNQKQQQWGDSFKFHLLEKTEAKGSKINNSPCEKESHLTFIFYHLFFTLQLFYCFGDLLLVLLVLNIVWYDPASLSITMFSGQVFFCFVLELFFCHRASLTHNWLLVTHPP